MKKQGQEVPFPGVDNSQRSGALTIRHTKYYQWVAFTLFFQVSVTVCCIIRTTTLPPPSSAAAPPKGVASAAGVVCVLGVVLSIFLFVTPLVLIFHRTPYTGEFVSVSFRYYCTASRR
uniref:Uncharacterized protein n=1 Tax=Anopheles maculatus TaxID=74869 RepID=A0A182SRK4_9DIPT